MAIQTPYGDMLKFFTEHERCDRRKLSMVHHEREPVVSLSDAELAIRRDARDSALGAMLGVAGSVGVSDVEAFGRHCISASYRLNPMVLIKERLSWERAFNREVRARLEDMIVERREK